MSKEESTDILDLLKVKEKEMEDLLDDARVTAKAIKAEVRDRVEEIKKEGEERLNKDIESMRKAAAVELERGARCIKDEARIELQAFESAARERADKAVAFAVNFILEGLSDKSDE